MNVKRGTKKALRRYAPTTRVSVVSEKSKTGLSALNRDAILKAFQEISDELGRRTVYPKDKVLVKAQYLVEGHFAEGKI